MLKFKAIGVSEGLAHAKALVIKEADLTVVKNSITDAAAEQKNQRHLGGKRHLQLPSGPHGGNNRVVLQPHRYRPLCCHLAAPTKSVPVFSGRYRIFSSRLHTKTEI